MSLTTNDIQRIFAPCQVRLLEQSTTSIEDGICTLDEETKQIDQDQNFADLEMKNMDVPCNMNKYNSIDHLNIVKQRQEKQSVLMAEELILKQHGYKKIGEILKHCKVFCRAEIFDANILSESAEQDEKDHKVNIIGHVDKYQHVAIKKLARIWLTQN